MNWLQSRLVLFAEWLRKKRGYSFPRVGPLLHKAFFRLMPDSVTVDLFPGMRMGLDLTDATQRGTYWHGNRYEKPTPMILSRWGQHATAFFDVGANYGFYSYWMLYKFPGLAVYAFEPNSRNYGLLRSNTVRNSLSHLHPFRLGLSDRKEELALHLAPEDSGYSTFADDPQLASVPVEMVTLVPFAAWAEKEGLAIPDRPSWICKIDVEGYEVKVLRGMSRYLAARAFIGLVVEINPDTLSLSNVSPHDIFDVMDGYGYVPTADCPSDPADYVVGQSRNAFFVLRR